MTNLPALGERTIWIDCDVIQADGGTRTASITGAFVALALALEKLRERDVIRTIPLSDYVAAISVGIVDGEPLLDLAYDDDSRADVDMNIVKTGDGRFIEVQGTAEAIPFGRDALMTLLDLADLGITQLVEKQRAIVGHLVKRPMTTMRTADAQDRRAFSACRDAALSQRSSRTPIGEMLALVVGRGALRARVHDGRGPRAR